MARILDFYAVRWEYEPHTFPIMWNLEGAVVESFAPDFYLPELDLYLEMTTLRQRLVRKKNRKLRRLRELYPGVNVKLFYARDFRALMLKYGKFALHDGLSGIVGAGGAAVREPPGGSGGRIAGPELLAAIVGDPVTEPGPAVAGAAVPVASSAGRRARRPRPTVGADEAVV